ncbi:MAG: TonB family protein [Flavobacteriales bacterium]|nr:TonB family protein [Flavobacteriales bacterium]
MKQVQKNKDRRNPLYFVSGLVFALSCTLVAFEWRFSSFSMNELPGNPIAVFTSEMDAVTIEEPPKVQPPAVKTEIRPDDLIQITDEPEPVEDDNVKQDNHQSDGTEGENPDLLLTGLFNENENPDPETPRIYAEVMPSFGSCHQLKDEDQKAACTAKNMGEYLRKHVEFPEIDRKAGNEGIVYVQFVVDENGKVKDAKILRGVNSRLDKEALRVVNQMPLWQPGKQGLKHVPVVYNIGINFSLK